MNSRADGTSGFDTDVGRLSLWLYRRNHKWQLEENPLIEVDLAETDAVSEGLLSSACLDFEVLAEDKEASRALSSHKHLYLYVGPRFDSSQRYPWCNRIRLERREVRGQLLWRVELQDAEQFARAKWRHARTWVLLAKANGTPVRLKSGAPLQWPVDLSYKREWVRDTFAGVLHDLLSLTVPTLEEHQGFIQKADLQTALTDGLDANVVLWAYYVAQELQTFVDILVQFLRRSGFRGGLQPVLMKLTAEDAQQYWSNRAYLRPTQILQAAGWGDVALPICFVQMEQQPIDGEMRVALAAARSALALARRLMAQLRAPIEHGLLASLESEETYRFIEVPLIGLERQSHRLIQQLYQVGVDVAIPATVDVNLPQIQTANAHLEAVRRQVSRLDRRANLVAKEGITLDLAIEATNKVYEDWCFLRVMHALFELGFAAISQPALKRGSIRDRVRQLYPSSTVDSLHMRHDRFDGTVVVRREPEYATSCKEPDAWYGAETRYSQGYISTTARKNNPDIALEFRIHGQQVPDLVVFDATAVTHSAAKERERVLREKFLYFDTLRAFQEQDPESGESRRIVRAAWALYPGTEGETTSYQCEMPEATIPSVKWRWGVYRLNAHAENLNELAPWLDQLLTQVGLLQPK